MNRAPINTAGLDWNEQGTPVSRHFEDVYFSTQDGLEETCYVFLQGNELPARFEQQDRPLFIVAETGFGTGLNFLTLWRAFDDFRQNRGDATLRRLHFISFEQFPLRAEDVALAHARWPALAPYSSALREQWPQPIAGCHRIILGDGAVTLDLWYGDVNALLPQLEASLDGQVDAWFFDGFSPAKNPSMWSDALFQGAARLGRPQSTFATFTAAGFVRRSLQTAGYEVVKRPGFGQKREMLVGRLSQPAAPLPANPWSIRRPAGNPLDVAIIGGGIAGALAAEALQRRGAQVTLYCADDAPAEGASGNRQGALYPLLNHENDALGQFFALAFPFACHYYRDSARRGVAFEHQWCGVTQLAYDPRSRRKIEQLLSESWPETLVRAVEAEEMAALTGLDTGCDGVTYPLGGWLNPAQFTAGTLRQACLRGLRLYLHHQVEDLAPTAKGWRLGFAHGEYACHDTVVLANGHHMMQWPQTRPLPLTNVRGQVSHIPSVPELATLRQVLCYDGYLTPASAEYGTHCLGASARRDDESIDYRPEEQQENRNRLLASLPTQPWARAADISAGDARCGVRSSARDHLPMIGGVPDYAATLTAYGDLPRRLATGAPVADAPTYPGLYMLGALGSRGLCSAPLSAEILAGHIFGEPLPLSRELSAALHPNRIWLRKLIRGRELA